MDPSLPLSESTTTTTLTPRILEAARDMSGWLKFIGVVTMLSGIPAALTIFGLIVAWIPIWLGLLLIQAGSAAQGRSEEDVLRMLIRLRTYFLIQGLLILLAMAAVLIVSIFFGAFILQALEMLRETAQPMLEA